jgi:hypothetical protein
MKNRKKKKYRSKQANTIDESGRRMKAQTNFQTCCRPKIARFNLPVSFVVVDAFDSLNWQLKVSTISARPEFSGRNFSDLISHR